MADALCGPSNALQSFQKHSQVDRTLQQDRLAGPRHSPGQGFRSHDPRSGSLDADFHAFEHATPDPFQFYDPFSIHSRQSPAPFQNVQQPRASGWAADFSKLHIAEQPLPAQQFRTEAPLMRSAPGGWQNEFMRHRQDNTTATARGKEAAIDQQRQSGFGTNSFMPYQTPSYMSAFAPQADTVQYDGQSAQLHGPQMIQSDAVEWSQAFDQAFEASLQDEQASGTQEDQILHQDRSSLNEQEMSLSTQDTENIRIGSDAIHYVETKDRVADQDTQDPNALARVAGELLHNVQHETSQKFQNSQFLDLMRKIRDKQVEVRNNDFESTDLDTIRNTANTTSAFQQEVSESQTKRDEDSFQFPDLNAVYEPTLADMTDYSFDADQYPAQPNVARLPVQDLHPGGRLYPGSPDQGHAQMSGGVASLPAEEFEKLEENPGLATRYQKPTVEPEGLRAP